MTRYSSLGLLCRRACLTSTRWRHLCGPESASIAEAWNTGHHFLDQKPRRKWISTTSSKGGQQQGWGKEGTKHVEITWRDVVEYGLKGLAVFLLSYAVYDEILLPWYHAYQKGRQLQALARVAPDEVDLEKGTGKEGSSQKTARSFSSAKCATHEDGGTHTRRSQQYNFLAEAVEKAVPSVVYIEKSQSVSTIFGPQMSVSTGSGFIVSEDGYVVTNAHVVGGARSVSVKLASGEVVKGEVTDLDQVADLALLKLSVKKKLPALEFGSSSSLRPGEWVVALGSPLSLSNTITAGIVSSCHRPSKELGLHHHGGPDIQYVQTDAPITVGNSGGPLVNLDGEVIGVNTLTAGPGISFAIPSDFAKGFVARANKTARSPGKFAIGISMLTVTPNLCHVLQQRGVIPGDIDHGVLVAQVWPSSVAAQAGLKKADVIVRINGREVASSRQVYDIVQSGKRLSIEIVRNSERKTVLVAPEKM